MAKVTIKGVKVLSPEAEKKLVDRLAGDGLEAAAEFLLMKFQQAVGVQAERVKIKGVKGGWRAKFRAVPGAMPRRVSGRGQKSLNWHPVIEGKKHQAVFMMIFYMLTHEHRKHPWIHKTFERNRVEIKRIIGGSWHG